MEVRILNQALKIAFYKCRRTWKHKVCAKLMSRAQWWVDLLAPEISWCDKFKAVTPRTQTVTGKLISFITPKTVKQKQITKVKAFEDGNPYELKLLYAIKLVTG